MGTGVKPGRGQKQRHRGRKSDVRGWRDVIGELVGSHVALEGLKKKREKKGAIWLKHRIASTNQHPLGTGTRGVPHTAHVGWHAAEKYGINGAKMMSELPYVAPLWLVVLVVLDELHCPRRKVATVHVPALRRPLQISALDP